MRNIADKVNGKELFNVCTFHNTKKPEKKQIRWFKKRNKKKEETLLCTRVIK